MKVAAIWKMGVDYCSKLIDPLKDGIFVIISDDAMYWNAWSLQYVIENNIPSIGESMKGTEARVDGTFEYPWDVVLDDLLNGRLGEPSEGINPLVNQNKGAACICDIQSLMRNGCPSSRGLSCCSVIDMKE